MKEFVDKLIDSIEKRKGIILSHNIIDAEDEAMVLAYNETINIIKIIAEEYNNGWIPCSERLPEENGEHLVTIRNLTGYYVKEKEVFACEYRYGDFLFNGWEDNEVIAWQPLPEPYKEVGTE